MSLNFPTGFIPTIAVSSGSRKLIVDFLNENNIPYMVSAASMYNLTRKKFVWRKYVTPTIVDSGGYSLMIKWGDFPFSTEQYGSYFDSKNVLYFSMDYPTEKWDPQECIRKTVDNWKKLPNSIPVVQGATPKDFIYCFEQLNEIRDFSIAGIGSICKRGSQQEIIEVISKLCGDHRDVHWHLFGLTQKAVPGIIRVLGYDGWSWDSHAWTFIPRDLRYDPNIRKVSGKIARKLGFKNNVLLELELLKGYLEKVSSFFPSRYQTKIGDYLELEVA